MAARGARAAAQPEKADRRADLMAHAENDAEFHDCLAAFREGLQKLGWVEGRNIQIDSRWGALDDAEAMQRSAKELIALQPDVIYAKHAPTATMLSFDRRTSRCHVASATTPACRGGRGPSRGIFESEIS